MVEVLSIEKLLSFLADRHGICISLRQLKRILASLGLKRRNLPQTSPIEIISAVIQELKGSGSSIGYKSLWKRFMNIYKIDIKRDTVLELLRIADPEGIVNRQTHRLRRRQYCVPAPNFLWHLDRYDKLKPYGFVIHGCVDGFSRKIMWLNVASSNNNPKISAHYYLQTVEELGFVPRVIRSNRGTENSIIENLQQALHFCKF